jgi:hypothetical protein
VHTYIRTYVHMWVIRGSLLWSLHRFFGDFVLMKITFSAQFLVVTIFSQKRQYLITFFGKNIIKIITFTPDFQFHKKHSWY